jgi:hypothetical protein
LKLAVSFPSIISLPTGLKIEGEISVKLGNMAISIKIRGVFTLICSKSFKFVLFKEDNGTFYPYFRLSSPLFEINGKFSLYYIYTKINNIKTSFTYGTVHRYLSK